MAHLSVVSAAENPLLYEAAYSFVLPKEKTFCSLMHKILLHDKTVYAVLNQSKKNQSQVVAVFAYNGSTALPCIVDCPVTKDIIDCLSIFFNDADISCVSGEASSVEYFKTAVKKIPSEEKPCTLMQSTDEVFSPAIKARIAQKKDEAEVVLMHTKFLKEEVVPAWAQGDTPARIASERLFIEKSISRNELLVLEHDNKIVSTAQVTAKGKDCILIGGVYTRPEERNKGYAKIIMQNMVQYAAGQNKTAVLFVQNKNTAAIKCYASAGFVPFAAHTVLYYSK